jgi:hypothetical protein
MDPNIVPIFLWTLAFFMHGEYAHMNTTASEEVRRRKLLRFLENDDPAWRDQNHPELGKDSGKWMRKLRAESEKRVDSDSRRTLKRRRAKRSELAIQS